MSITFIISLGIKYLSFDFITKFRHILLQSFRNWTYSLSSFFVTSSSNSLLPRYGYCLNELPASSPYLIILLNVRFCYFPEAWRKQFILPWKFTLKEGKNLSQVQDRGQKDALRMWGEPGAVWQSKRAQALK